MCVNTVSVSTSIGLFFRAVSASVIHASHRLTRWFIRQILALIFFQRQLKSAGRCWILTNKDLHTPYKVNWQRKRKNYTKLLANVRECVSLGIWRRVCACVPSCVHGRARESGQPAPEHIFRCITGPRILIFTRISRFATGTIIFVQKQNEHHNPFPKWPRHGAAGNHIICRFNWKYKSPFTRHYRQLWYTPCQLMHDDTLQMWRVTFKYHGTLGIGAQATHFSCLCILLAEIGSSVVSFCHRLDWLDFFCGRFLHLTEPGRSHFVVAVVFMPCFFALSFTNTAGVPYSNTFHYMVSLIALSYWYYFSSGRGGACMVVHLKRLQAPCTSPCRIAMKCNALSINHWTVCCFHNGVMKTSSTS